MTQQSIRGQRALVVGGSRGLGLGIAESLAQGGADVTILARPSRALDEVGARFDGRVRTIAADATDPATAPRVFDEVDPQILVIAAGASPTMRPLAQQTWETFSAVWEVDAKLTFHWVRELLQRPDNTCARVVVLSSGAALHGSPLSGGYAPAKQAQRFITQYARKELAAAGRSVRVHTILPQLNPNTRLGAAGVRAYASAAGMDEEAFVADRFGTPLTPQIAGQQVVALLEDPERAELAEALLAGQGLRAL